jgi:transcriptional regulator with XRE-family HTH domain
LASNTYDVGVSDQPADIIEQLKDAISNSGLSRYALSCASGVEQSALSRFMSGERGLSLESAARLADVLGLEMRPKRSRKGK